MSEECGHSGDKAPPTSIILSVGSFINRFLNLINYIIVSSLSLSLDLYSNMATQFS